MQPSEFIVGADGKKCHNAGPFDRLLGVSCLQSHFGVVAALKDSSGLVRAQHPTGLTMSKQNADCEERTGEHATTIFPSSPYCAWLSRLPAMPDTIRGEET